MLDYGQSKWIVCILVIVGLLPLPTFAESMQSCGNDAKKTGETYKINGSGINVRKGPGISYSKIINQAATRILKSTHYITVGGSTTVVEECTQGLWSKIHVTDPDYSKSHRGWIASKFLRRKKIDSSGTEVFVEADFYFDKKTRAYKNLIIAGVNKAYRENSKCKNMDPSSAYISSSKGSESNPVFYVTCGKGAKTFNVFFSKSDVENDKRLTAKKHISKLRAIELCENYAKSNATHPSTVDFSRVMELSSFEAPNGRTRISSAFTAKNSFNLELKYKISCFLDSDGLIEANIYEAL